jgi:hypothetical protein
VPHHKIKEILRTASPDELQVAAFLRGYGLSPKELATMARELRVLGALREIDTLRWAIEKQPGMIASLGERARRAVANLDQVRRLRGRIRVVRRTLTGSAGEAEVGPYQACGCSIEDRTRALPRWS